MTLCTFHVIKHVKCDPRRDAIIFGMKPFLIAFVCAATVVAQENDLAVIAKIKAEAFDRSRVMDTLGFLTDVYGPRLTGSPEFRKAADWAVKRLQGDGVENAKLEKWGTFGRAWSLKQSSLEMIEPGYAALDAAALAWSDSSNGTVSGEVVYAPFGSIRQSQDPKQAQDDLEKYMAQWKGKLRGKIVLISRAPRVRPATQAPFSRYTDKDLGDQAAAPSPSTKFQDVDVNKLEFPEDPDQLRDFNENLPEWVSLDLFLLRRAATERRAKFLKDEGVLAVLSRGGSNGLVFAQGAGPYGAKDTLAPPSFAVTDEQYNRMLRLIDKKIPVKVRASLQADISRNDEDGYNVVGEIPGGAKKDEVVMIGAHFDSWHSGTGATDNGAGSAVMIEVMRILKTLNLKLDRTVRIALWSGEEQGLFGSRFYVKEHFADPQTMQVSEAHSKLSGYFNLDNGSGKIRGVYLQGNDQMRPVFERWLAPFRDLGVTTISIRDTGGTDHLSFDDVGLPGFQFIQDPLDYGTVTHHSTADTFDHVQAPDLMQAAAVIATLVYDTANRPERLPRKELPAAHAKKQATLP
jgi:hypothetical protein